MNKEDEKQERLNRIASEMIGDEVEITDAELDTEVRAQKGEEFGYEK